MSRVIADGLSDKALALISSSIDADTLDGIDSLGFDAAGAADTAVSDHVALPDPHSQYAELSGGADANFTTMPQVGGDPIVESGSNADGEWTRWADGTQIVKNSSLLCTFSSVNTLTNSWTYPASFNTQPVCVHTLIDSRDGGGNFTVNETTIDNISAMLRSISEFSAKVRISGSSQFSSGDTYYASVTATGRWK